MHVLLVPLALFSLSQVPETVPSSRPLHDVYRVIRRTEAEALESIAGRFEARGGTDLAKSVRALIEPEDGSGPLRFRPLPEFVPARGQGLANLPIDRAVGGGEDVSAIRARTAKGLFALAGRAAAANRYALADRCLRGVLERDPNHAEARRLIGFIPYQGGWATPHAADLLNRGFVLHPKFDWVAADWVPHLDRGELPGEMTSGGKPREWLPAEDADGLRNRFARGWQIKTAPHFEIQTDVPLAEAVAFGRRLEGLHEVFFSELADVIGRDLPLARRYANPNQKPVATPKKFQVAYFAEKGEYVDYFKSHFFQDESISLGYYMPPKQAQNFPKTQPRSYFYRDDANPIAAHTTLYHEASHQLLFETVRGTKIDESRPNYWIWEGLGTYFETVTPQQDGSILVGGLVGPRIDSARTLLQEGKFLPLKEFVAMNKTEFGREDGDAVYHHYAQAMALTVFLLHGEEGQYREAFLDHVADAYRSARPKTLPIRLGVPLDVLDAQFRAYLK